MMKFTVRFFAAYLAASSVSAGTVDVTWRFSDHTGSPQSVKRVAVTPLSALGLYNSTNIVFSIPISKQTDSTGSLTVSNLANSYNYRIQLFDSLNKELGIFTNSIGTNVSGAINGRDYLVISTSLGNGFFAYSKNESDVRFQPLSTNLNDWSLLTTNLLGGGGGGGGTTYFNNNNTVAFISGSNIGTNTSHLATTNALTIATNRVSTNLLAVIATTSNALSSATVTLSNSTALALSQKLGTNGTAVHALTVASIATNTIAASQVTGGVVTNFSPDVYLGGVSILRDPLYPANPGTITNVSAVVGFGGDFTLDFVNGEANGLWTFLAGLNTFGNISAASFTGNASGLTNLPAGAIIGILTNATTGNALTATTAARALTVASIATNTIAASQVTGLGTAALVNVDSITNFGAITVSNTITLGDGVNDNTAFLKLAPGSTRLRIDGDNATDIFLFDSTGAVQSGMSGGFSAYNGYFQNNVTASLFNGSGANLTGLTAAQLSGLTMAATNAGAFVATTNGTLYSPTFGRQGEPFTDFLWKQYVDNIGDGGGMIFSNEVSLAWFKLDYAGGISSGAGAGTLPDIFRGYNASGLTNLTATNLTGTIALARYGFTPATNGANIAASQVVGAVASATLATYVSGVLTNSITGNADTATTLSANATLTNLTVWGSAVRTNYLVVDSRGIVSTNATGGMTNSGGSITANGTATFSNLLASGGSIQLVQSSITNQFTNSVTATIQTVSGIRASTFISTGTNGVSYISGPALGSGFGVSQVNGSGEFRFTAGANGANGGWSINKCDTLGGSINSGSPYIYGGGSGGTVIGAMFISPTASLMVTNGQNLNVPHVLRVDGPNVPGALMVATNGTITSAGGLATNNAAYTTSSNPTNQFIVDTLYTNAGQRTLIVGSAVLNSGVSGNANITMTYTNSGVGYTLPMQIGLGVAMSDSIPFCVPLSSNATFKFTATMGTGATGWITNTVLWKQ